MAPVVVTGATSWGVTLAWLLASNGHETLLLCRDAEEVATVRHHRGLERIPEVTLPESVIVASEPPGEADGIVFATPAQSLRRAAAVARGLRGVPALSAAKGIEHRTHLRMTQVLAEAGWAPGVLSALSGPNLAHEVAAGLPAATVVASAGADQSPMWQGLLAAPSFRVYCSDDVVGVELAGALKNVIAIAAGACAGFGLGSNAMAAVMTRGLAEITRLGVALGARPLTFQGLAGVGDLAATCMSPLSRNHRLGELLAKGQPLQAALHAIGEAVEGAETAPVALELAREAGIDLPITEQVCAVLAGRADARTAMAELLRRAPASGPETIG